MSQDTLISANTSKVSYTGAAQVATNVTNIAANVTSLATKSSLTGNQTLTGRQQFGDGSSTSDGRLTIYSDSGGTNSLLILDSRKQVSSCLVYFRHAGSNKFTIGLNGDSDLEIYNRATGAAQISLPTGGGVIIEKNIGFFGETPVAQQETTGTTAGFTANSGTALNFSTTFTGDIGSTAFTCGDIVRALKNLGLLKM